MWVQSGMTSGLGRRKDLENDGRVFDDNILMIPYFRTGKCFGIIPLEVLNMQDCTCPNCGSEDTVKVALEYDRGKRWVEYTSREVVGYKVKTERRADEMFDREISRTPIWGDVKHSEMVLTPLAKKIAPPEKPQEPTLDKNAGCLFNLLRYGLFFYVGMWLASFAISIVRKFFGDDAISLILCVVVFVFWGIGIFIFKRKTDDWFLKYSGRYDAHKQNLEEYKQALMKYNEEFAAWQHTFICRRCGTTFRVD